jgi:hypothetical protein
VIAEVKKESYRQFTDEISQGDGLWKLSRWSKATGGGLLQVPTLRAGHRLAEDHSSKGAMLRETFFPITSADLSDIESQVNQAPIEKFFPITSVDLSDIESQVNQAPITVEQSTTIEEITATLASCSMSSAPGDDKSPA